VLVASAEVPLFSVLIGGARRSDHRLPGPRTHSGGSRSISSLVVRRNSPVLRRFAPERARAAVLFGASAVRHRSPEQYFRLAKRAESAACWVAHILFITDPLALRHPVLAHVLAVVVPEDYVGLVDLPCLPEGVATRHFPLSLAIGCKETFTQGRVPCKQDVSSIATGPRCHGAPSSPMRPPPARVGGCERGRWDAEPDKEGGGLELTGSEKAPHTLQGLHGPCSWALCARGH
jgi:hypothetical protein